jgi:DNA-binding transcriptional LysR family regulator
MNDQPLTLKSPGVLRSLQYFESVARHGSVRRAAEEHRVSASAISHHLRDLRALLGEELLARSGRGVRLTEAGERLYRHASVLFAGFESALQDVLGQAKPVIRLAVCSSFGPAWLAPRLPDFLRLHPATDIEVRLYTRDPLQTETVADAIVTANPVTSGFEAVDLFEEMLVAVGGRALACDGDGMPARLVTTDLRDGQTGKDWHDFARLSGRNYPGAATQGMMGCTHYLQAMALAQAGVGAALVPDFLAAEALSNGSLRQISPSAMPAGRTYRLCYKVSRAGEAEIRALAQWMRSQARSTKR